MFHPQGPTLIELAVQALSSTERGYDLLAPKFDYTPFRTPDDLLAKVSAYIGSASSVEAALDVCCGTGAAMRMLRPLCRQRVVGLDMSQGMIDTGRDRMAGAPGCARVDFVRADALDMPFREEFDVAVCFGALGHILNQDQPRFIQQIAQVLKPGGRFVFVSSFVSPLWSRRYWVSRAFNAAMQIRNSLISPPFVMYYLNFLLPHATDLLRDNGFDAQVHRDVFGEPWDEMCLVIGVRKGVASSW